MRGVLVNSSFYMRGVLVNSCFYNEGRFGELKFLYEGHFGELKFLYEGRFGELKFLYEGRFGEHIHSVSYLVPIKVEAKEVPGSVLAFLHHKTLPAVHHPQIVKDDSIALPQLVRHHMFGAVAEAVEQLEGSEQVFGFNSIST